MAKSTKATAKPRAPEEPYTGNCPLYKILGKVSSTPHQNFVKDLVERYDFFLKQNAKPWENSVRWNRLFLAQKNDVRVSTEDLWMADVFVPEPFSGAMSKVATISDILNSADPPIQPEPVGEEDFDNAKPVTRLLDYTMRKNSWRGRRCPGILQRSAVQGTEVVKLVWTNQFHDVMLYPDQKAKDEFRKRLADSMNTLGIKDRAQVPDFQYDPAAFNVWRDMANKTGRVSVPEIPSRGKKTIQLFRGPLIQRVPLTDILVDPLVDDMQAQNLVIHRMLKKNSWLREQVKAGKYEGEAVEACIKVGGDVKLSSYETQINEMLGVSAGPDRDPYYRDDTSEVLECWMLEGETVKYAVVVNRHGVVNRDPSRLPFEHGMYPFTAARNIWVPGFFHGIGEFQETESLYEEQNLLRSLRINRTILETFPVFTKLQEFGLPELRRKLQPGAFIPVMRQGAVDQLIKYTQTHAFEDMRLTSENIADANATYGSVKGAPALVNRVSATESEGRRQQALVRIKLQAVMMEDEFQPMVQQMLGLWHQKGDQDLQTKVAGPTNPFANVSETDIVEAMEADYRFRGATRTLQKDIVVQQLNQLLKDNGAMMIPPEIRATIKILLETAGLKGISKMLTQEGDKFFQNQYEIQATMLEQQVQQAKAMSAVQGNTPPTQVSPEVAAALEQEMGGVAGIQAGAAGQDQGAGAGEQGGEALQEAA